MVGVSQKTVSAWETGQTLMPLEFVAVVARALEIPEMRLRREVEDAAPARRRRQAQSKTVPERLAELERLVAELNLRYDEIIATLERDPPRSSKRAGGRRSAASP